MKLCYDCKHCEKVVIMGNDYSKCHHPRNVDPVTGGARYFCSTLRKLGGCYVSARWFEPKVQPIVLKDMGVAEEVSKRYQDVFKQKLKDHAERAECEIKPWWKFW
jgi:hypothetical protein